MHRRAFRFAAASPRTEHHAFVFLPFESRPSRFRLGRFCKCGWSSIRIRACLLWLDRLLNSFPPLLIKLLRHLGKCRFCMAGHLICRILFRSTIRRRSAALHFFLGSDKGVLHALSSHDGFIYGLYRSLDGIAHLDVSHRAPLRIHPRRGALSSVCRALCPWETG